MPKQFESKEKAREAIVAAAGRRLRETGFDGIGVDGLMSAAGLTSGAFYTQFNSKSDLLREVIKRGLEDLRERFRRWRSSGRKDWFKEGTDEYLSRQHRKHVAEGCVLPSLSVDVARAGYEAQELFASQLKELVSEIEKDVPPGADLTARQRAWATLALMAGGVMLARAMPEGKTTNELLEACRAFADR